MCALVCVCVCVGGGGVPCGCVLSDSRFKKRRFVFEEQGTMQHTSLSLWRAFFTQKGSWKRNELAAGTGSHCYRVSNSAEPKPHDSTTVCFALRFYRISKQDIFG